MMYRRYNNCVIYKLFGANFTAQIKLIHCKLELHIVT